MDLEDYAVLLKDAINRTETIVFSCRCQVRYSGRAESYLDTGDRVVMIKSDGALLIHQPTGNAPINYMKPGTSHTLIINSGKLKLKSNNIHQKESIDVSIDKMHFFNSHKLEDAQNIIVSGTEDDMSDMIYRNPAMIED